MFRVVRSPRFVRRLFNSATWSLQKNEKVLYLSFDDGPTARTSELLKLLRDYHAKATFFCVGQNVVNNVFGFQQIKADGHRVGNHGFSHLKGWKVSKQQYLNDVQRANEHIQSDLFRPPYGKMTLGQYRALKKKYHIVMWSHLAYDFDKRMSSKQFLKRLKNDFQGGEIIVLHDNLKYFDKSMEMLRDILNWSKSENIRCLSIP